MSYYKNKINKPNIINDSFPTIVTTQDYHSSITAKNSHLILSSSAGSYVIVSGTLNVLGSLLQNGIQVSGGAAGAAGEVTGSTNFFAINRLDAQGVLLNSSGNLIISSSKGSIIAFSASADFTETDKNYHLRSINSYLILSSSVGSNVVVSGTIRIPSGNLNINSGGIIVQGGGIALNARYTANNASNALVTIGTEGSNYFSVVTNAAPFIHIDAGNLGFLNGAQTYDTFGNLFSRGSFIFTPAAGTSARIVVAVATGSIYSVESNLILSSSASGSVVAFSASVDFPNVDKTYHIRSVNSDLILSSSARSVIFISGALSASDKTNTFNNLSPLTTLGDLIVYDGTNNARKAVGADGLILVADSTAPAGIKWSSSSSLTTLNTFSQSINSFTASINIFSQSVNTFSASQNIFSQSVNTFTSSFNIFSQSINGFTSSFSASVSAIGDLRYILTSSAIEQRIDSNLVSSGTLKIKDTISNYSQNLILSSTIGSIVSFSASANFTEADKNYHIRTVNSDLILSSSTSIITPSGSLNFPSGSITITSGTLLARGPNTALNARYTSNDANGVLVTVGTAGSNYFSVVTNTAPFIHMDTAVGFLNGLTTYDTLQINSARGAFLFSPAAGGNGRIVLAVATGSIFAVDGPLYLSSSVGSIVGFSASADFLNADKPYHVRALNGDLILSSTIGSVVSMSASIDLPNADKAYHIRAVNSNLIFSSTVGSIISFSSSLDFPNLDKNYHIRAVNNSLILSSTAGTIVSSGAFQIKENGLSVATFSHSSGLTMRYAPSTGQFVNIGSAGSGYFVINDAAHPIIRLASTLGIGTVLSRLESTVDGTFNMGDTAQLNFINFNTVAGTIWANKSLILSSSIGSVVALSASEDYVNSDKNYHIRALNSHLILSSTIGSVIFISGALSASDKTNTFNNLSPLTTNGDLIVYSGSINIRKAVGTNNQVLTADSTAIGGIKWVDTTTITSMARTFMLMGA